MQGKRKSTDKEVNRPPTTDNNNYDPIVPSAAISSDITLPGGCVEVTEARRKYVPGAWPAGHVKRRMSDLKAPGLRLSLRGGRVARRVADELNTEVAEA